MEAIYFSIGVLTMVLVASAALAVYSTVMVTKLKKENNDFQRQLHDVYRVISEREDSLRTEMRLGERELNLQMDQLNEHISQLTSSTDRRFDKMLSSFLLKEYEAKHSKEIIKG
jgi:hypothetical protein